jgi:hypothetical protein
MAMTHIHMNEKEIIAEKGLRPLKAQLEASDRRMQREVHEDAKTKKRGPPSGKPVAF